MAKLNWSALWSSLSLAARFRLLMACTVAPAMLLLFLYVQERRSVMRFSEQELKGAHYVEAMLKLRLQPWKGGKASVEGREAVEKAQARYGSELKTAEGWEALKAAMAAPAAGGAAGSMPPAVREAWGKLYTAVADASNLILDPDLDSYYLMDAVCLSLATQRGWMDELAELVASVQRSGSHTDRQVFQAQLLLAELGGGAKILARNYKVVFAQAHGQKEQADLEGALLLYTQALEGLGKQGPDAALTPEQLLRLQKDLLRAQGNNEVFWSASLAALEHVIETRVAELRRGLWLSLSVVACILVLALLLSRGVLSGVLQPLQHLTREVEFLQRGDLRRRDFEAGEDEMGRFVKGVDALRQRLAELPQVLAGAAGRLADCVESMKQDHLVQGSILESQASALAETQVTSEEIRQTSRQAAAQAQGLINEANKARELSRAGGETLGKSLDSLLAIRSRVELLAADVEALEARARRIEGIIDSVKDLADQSNLLALNAAIEAMRAGAQGQGFGLVAHEIRALADQSIKATEQVRQVLGDLSDGVREAAKASRQGVHDIQKGLERVQGSAETLADIQDSVSDSVGRLQRIADVVQQQDAGLGQVFLALKDQNDRMTQAMRQQEKTAAAVLQLEEASDTVENVVKGFKI